MINPRQNRSEVDLSASIPWINDSGEEIPAYAVVQLRTNFDTTSHASKTNGSEGLFFVSGFAPVAIGKNGESLLWNRPRPVLIEAGVAVGEEVGPVDNEWVMGREGAGFRVLRQPNGSGVGVVVPVEDGRRQAVLLADLPAAVNTKRDPSTALAAVLRRKLNGDLTRSNLVLPIVNRFEHISIDAGTYIKIERMDGEWQPYSADCPGGSLSESI